MGTKTETREGIRTEAGVGEGVGTVTRAREELWTGIDRRRNMNRARSRIRSADRGRWSRSNKRRRFRRRRRTGLNAEEGVAVGTGA
jgi:hypothetical protein